jgi:hypothetical protein
MTMSGRSPVRLRYSPQNFKGLLIEDFFFAQLAGASRHDDVGKVTGSTPVFSTSPAEALLMRVFSITKDSYPVTVSIAATGLFDSILNFLLLFSPF